MEIRVNTDNVDWDESQRVVTEDGPLTGEVVEYYPNGVLAGLQTYRNGFKDGPERQYHPDGSLSFEGEWMWSRGVGTHRHWYPGGQLEEENLYDDGGQLVDVRRWCEDGSLLPSQR